MLRWKYFVQSEDDAFVELIDAFTKATGVKVNVTREVARGRAAQSLGRRQHRRRAPTCSGACISLPHLFPQKCVDVTDVADYLGKKYGGWVPTRRRPTARAATSGSPSRSATAAT